MARPAILTVDDDPAVARAIERDLRRQYGEKYRVVRAESGEEGLEVLRRLKLRDERVALILADQRMPRMNGVEFLEEAIAIYPETRRALLTAYADTDAAIKAINDVELDFYLRKPWEPPDANLYPVVDDLLERWFQTTPKEGEDVRIIAPRVDAESHALRDMLARNSVPYRWLDADADPEAKRLLTAAGLERPHMPVAVLKDGSALEAPTPLELAERLKLPTRAQHEVYDLVIIGAGPAGLAAGVYGGSEGLRTLMVEREAPGGQAGQSSLIENYLGFPNGLSGQELATRAFMQARRFHTEVLSVQAVTGLEEAGSSHAIKLSDGSEVRAHAALIATGVSYRRLEAPGVEELTGAGIYYGAPGTADDTLAGEHVLVVGAANSAGQAVMDLATKRAARQVTLLCRGDSLEKAMSQYLVDRIRAQRNVEVMMRTEVARAEGNGRLQQVMLTTPDGEKTVEAGAMFVFIGARPETSWLDGRVERDERGFILSGPDLVAGGRRPTGWSLERDPFLLETSAPGVFVAGDVRHGSMKRVASSVGEGAMAVRFVHEHLAGR